MNKYLSNALKILFSLGVLGYLIWRANSESLFDTLWRQEKDFGLIAFAVAAYLGTILIQIFRWRLLARALQLNMSYGEGLRLGFLSQLFSLLGVGMLGGDALKIYFLGKQNAGHATEAFTSVFLDRFIGLYGLVVMAGIITLQFDTSTLAVSLSATESAIVLNLCRLSQWGALVSTVLLMILLLPGVTTWAAWDLLANIPKIGMFFKKVVAALRMYRAALPTLFSAILLSFAIHFCNALIYYCLSLALPAYATTTAESASIVIEPVPKPSFIAHMTAALLALATGALPVGGLELVFNATYRAVSSPLMPEQQGFLLVLAFRLIQMATATIGLYYYLRSRHEVDQLMQEAETYQHHQPANSVPEKRVIESPA